MPSEHRHHSDIPSDDQPDHAVDLNDRPETPETPEATDLPEPAHDAADSRAPEQDAREDPFVAAERYLLEHPPTEEEIRSRDALLDQLDAEFTAPAASDDAADHAEAARDLLPLHGEDSPPEGREPQSPVPAKEGGDHANVPNEDNIAPPVDALAERETGSNPEDLQFPPPEERATLPKEAHDEPSATLQPEPIRDATTLDAALDQHPHLRDRPDFPDLRADCDTYFQALSHRDALTHGDTTVPAIADTVGTYPEQVRRWLSGDQQPRLLWLLDFDRTTATARHDLEHTDTTPATPSDAILRAARDPTYREQLLRPSTFSPEAVDVLLALRTPGNSSKPPDPTIFTRISDSATYEQALRAFPLIQEHPHFDALHRQAQLYFQLRDHPLLRSDGRLPTTALTDYADISKSTLHTWLTGERRPHLLTLLEERAATLKDYQDRVATLRDLDGGITSIHDLAHRLNPTHFMFGDQVVNDPKFTEQLTTASQYLAALTLVQAGYHPHDLEVHFHLTEGAISERLRYQHRSDLVRLAASIPDTLPDPGRRWLPTATDASNLPARYIQAPPEITDYKDLLPVLDSLPTPANPDYHLTRQLRELGPDAQLLQKWTEQFGSIRTAEDRLRAFAYLIGTTLSDGTITRQSTFSSTYCMELSTKYAWSQGYGDRAAYYLTSLGIPTKPGPIIEAGPNQPHDQLQWWSVTNPFLTWFKESVLGLQPGETHTYTPAKIDWVLQAPPDFQVKVLQGLFDGDGWATKSLTEIGIHNHQNRDLIQTLLRQEGITATKSGDYELVIKSNESIRAAARLPVFLSAAGRQRFAEAAAKMTQAPRSIGYIHDPAIIGRILDLHKQGTSGNEIRHQLHDEHNVVLSNRVISRVIRDGFGRLQISEAKVNAYFSLLEQRLENPQEPVSDLARKVCKETGFEGNIDTMAGWIRESKIPRDVRIAVTNGYLIPPRLVDAYAQLRKCRPELNR